MKSTSKLIIFFTFLALAAGAYAQTPRGELQQMVEQLQKSPNDNALREKIIKLGAEIKPAPAIPEEANRAFVKGNIFQKEAKDASVYDLAIAAYRDALRAAPWWGDAYFNLSVALETAGKFDEAIASIKFYMVSVAKLSSEAREAQNKIYALEARKEISVNSAEARAARAGAQQESFLRGLDGGVWLCSATAVWTDTIEIRGNRPYYLSVHKTRPDLNRSFQLPAISGKEFKVPYSIRCNRNIDVSESNSCDGTAKISDDGNTISYPILSAPKISGDGTMGGTTYGKLQESTEECRRTK
jgi:tetratricopeptide (TPR) repeat protein